MPFPILISAPKGRSGKTTVCISLALLLKRRGYTVQCFKKGPDYIDPSWLTAASGRVARNLDPFLFDEETLLGIFHASMEGADIAIIEGAMGLFDGPFGPFQGSTSELAKILGAPVILVVDVERMTYSVAALLRGFLGFDREVRIEGVILNRVSSARHEEKLRSAIESYVGLPVFGAIPKDLHISIKQRHLGLVPFREEERFDLLGEIERRISGYIDVDTIIEVCKACETKVRKIEKPPFPDPSFTVGVFFDRIFHFYYVENLEALKREGARLLFIDTLRERTLPCVDGLYIGGGFPELFLSELEANRSLREHIASEIERGLPVYGECAGLMYLCRRIAWKGRTYEMVGTIDATCEVLERPVGHGYVEVEVVEESPLFPKGMRFLGHEFHYSRIAFHRSPIFLFRMVRGYGIDGARDGILYKNVFCSYMHMNALANPFWAKGFAHLIKLRKNKETGGAFLCQR